MKIIFILIILLIAMKCEGFNTGDTEPQVFRSIVLEKLYKDCPIGKREFSISYIFNDQIFLTGGVEFNSTVPFTSTYAFNLTSYQWKEIDEVIPHVLWGYARSHAVANGTELLVFGGADTKGQIVGDLLRMNLQTLDYNISSNYPMKNDRSLLHTASFYNASKFYNFGGVDEAKEVSDLLRIYDFNNNVWTVNSTGVFRYGHTLIFNGSDVYMIGGFNEKNEVTNSTYRLTIKNKIYCWDLVLFEEPYLPPLAYHKTIITQEDDVILFGGINQNQEASSSIYAMRLAEPTLYWYDIVPHKGKEWPIARFGHNQVYSDNRVILFGGEPTDLWELVIPEYCNRHQDCDSCVVEGCGWCMTNFTSRKGKCYPGNAKGPFIQNTCLSDLSKGKSWMLLGQCLPPPVPKYLIPTLIVTTGVTIIIIIAVVIWTKKMIEEENYITVN